jgi:apoptosis-inducing factor 2
MPVFALGDVAEHSGPRMARAGFMQAGVVLDNILALVKGQPPTKIYKPNVFVEGAIKLTLGKAYSAMYAAEEDGSDFLIPSKNGPLDLGIKRAWWQYGADFKSASPV